jgi:catechol 2,3-dioxygenase-like lactoylglutathione lyase family enzyme
VADEETMSATGRSSVGVLEHVGVTVPSLDDAIGFFTNVIGWTLVLREGPFADAEGDWMRAALNVDRSASLSFALLDTGAGRYIELFEYAAPGQRLEHPLNSDIGGMHLAVAVPDIVAAIERLRDVPGIRILAGPNTNSAGGLYVYFLTPWDLQMELIQRAPGFGETA